MYTFCTHCQTAQEVTREMLVPTRGELECSHCRQRFDALETLSRDPPPGRIVARRKTVPDDIQPSLFTAPLPAEPMHPAASVPAHGERSDPIAEILCAHADFIEPPVPEYDDAALAGAEADALSPTDADEGRAPQAHATSEPQDASSEETPAQDAAAQVSSEAVDSPAPQSGTVSPPRDAVVLDLRDALDLALRAPAPSFLPGAQTPATERSARRWPARSCHPPLPGSDRLLLAHAVRQSLARLHGQTRGRCPLPRRRGPAVFVDAARGQKHRALHRFGSPRRLASRQ